jgi:NADH-quinone oxidoreductase subunit F
MYRVVDRLARGEGSRADIDLLIEVSSQIGGHTICGLGDAAAGPIQGLIRNFRHVIEERIDAATLMAA